MTCCRIASRDARAPRPADIPHQADPEAGAGGPQARFCRAAAGSYILGFGRFDARLAVAKRGPGYWNFVMPGKWMPDSWRGKPARQLPQYLRVTDCDSADRYDFQAVRPGDYYLVAVPSGMRVDFGKLDYGLLNQAGRVTVRTGEASSADLRLAAPQ